MNPDEKVTLGKSQALNHWTAQKIYYHIGKKHQRRLSNIIKSKDNIIKSLEGKVAYLTHQSPHNK